MDSKKKLNLFYSWRLDFYWIGSSILDHLAFLLFFVPRNFLCEAKILLKKERAGFGISLRHFFAGSKFLREKPFSKTQQQRNSGSFEYLYFFCLWLIAAVKFALITMVIFFITVVTSMIKGGALVTDVRNFQSFQASLLPFVCEWPILGNFSQPWWG